MTLEQSTLPVFAGHQTFHPRFGWIKKGFDAVAADPEVFSDPQAPLILGVGKNMVEAIRFWGVATKAWCRVPDQAKPRAFLHVPTGFGSALLSDDGFDPYLEMPGSLWLLHWYALSAPSTLPIWWLTFDEFSPVEFTDEDLDRFSLEQVAGTTWRQPNASSVKKDVDCMLRMYTQRKAKGRQTLDDLLDSPFRELGLIVPSGLGGNRYRFALGSKPTLPAEIIGFACLDYMAITDPHARTASVTRLMADPGSPGRLFKLSEQALLEALESVVHDSERLRLASPGGSPQVIVEGQAVEAAEEVLNLYYGVHRRVGPKTEGSIFAGSLGRQPDGDGHLLPVGTDHSADDLVVTT